MPKPCIGSRLSVLSLLFAAEFVSAQRVKQLGHAIVEFTSPGKGVQDSFVTNQDDVASGDLFFKSAGGGIGLGHVPPGDEPSGREGRIADRIGLKLNPNYQFPTPNPNSPLGSWKLGVGS
jgi:hypothetical protein